MLWITEHYISGLKEALIVFSYLLQGKERAIYKDRLRLIPTQHQRQRVCALVDQ